MGPEKQLIKAVQCGDEDTVQALIDAGTSIDSLNGMLGTPLCAALFANQLGMVKLLLANKCDVNAKDYDGGSPLCITIRKNLNKCAKLLIDIDGCDLNQTDPITKQPPLYMAVSQNNLEIMTYLVQAGCNVNQKGPEGNSALQKAILMQNSEAVTILLKCDQIDIDIINDNGLNSLHIAVLHGNIDILKLLITHLDNDIRGTPDDCEKSHPIDAQSMFEKNTALHYAVIVKDVERIRLLIKHGSDINMPNVKKQSPLFIACESNKENIVKVLLELGADPNCMALQQKTFHAFVKNCLIMPIHLAVIYGNLELVRMLAEAGAHMNVQDEMGETPLFYALYRNKSDIAEYLLSSGPEKGLDVNVQDHHGSTSIYAVSCCNGARQLTEKLLELGCSVNHVNKSSNTPLHSAVEMDCSEVAEVLLDNGADVNWCTDDLSLLHMTAFEDQVDVARLLIFYGADINLITEDGDSALYIALENSSIDVATLLINYGYNVSKEDFNVEITSELPEVLQVEDELRDLLLSSRNKPVSLGQQCRIAIRCFFLQQKLPMKSMCQLPLPKKLKDFMMLKEL